MSFEKISKKNSYSPLEKVKNNIANHKIPTSISKLIEIVVFNSVILKDCNSDYHNSLINLSARYYKNEKDRFSDLLPYGLYIQELNKIVHSMTNLITELENEEIRHPKVYHEDNYHTFVYYNFGNSKNVELIENFFFDVGIIFFHGIGSDNLLKLSNRNNNKIILFISQVFINDYKNLKFLFDILTLKERIVDVFIILLNDLKYFTIIEILEMIKAKVSASIEVLCNFDFNIEEKDRVKLSTKLDSLFNSNNTFRYGDLKKQNYFPMLKLLGYKDLHTLDRCLSIYYTSNKEKQNSEMISEILNNPENKISLITRAKVLIKRNEFLEAKTIFNHLINQQPSYAITYYCLAELLINQYQDEFHDLHIAKGYIYKGRSKYEADSSFISRFDKLYDYLILDQRRENYL